MYMHAHDLITYIPLCDYLALGLPINNQVYNVTTQTNFKDNVCINGLVPDVRYSYLSCPCKPTCIYLPCT